MKRIQLVLAIVVTIALFGCGAAKNGANTPGNPNGGTNMAGGTWAINMQGTGLNSVTNVVFVQSACTPAGTLLGNISVTGPVCFDFSGTLSASQNSAPFEFLSGVPANPVPDGSTVSFLYGIDTGSTGQLWVFIATGTVSGSNWSGTWACDSAVTTGCGTLNGTFTATLATAHNSAQGSIAR